jgi:mannosyltransferase OCH1-like enzyme
MIPKIIHIAWKTKNILDSDSIFIKNCIGNLVSLADQWDTIIYDDNDIDQYLKENLDRSDYQLLKPKHIIEKSDVWRLIKMYKEGGLYVDIDRLCNIPLDIIAGEDIKVVLPTCKDLDFSQDFMMSESNNPIFIETLKLNLERRHSGCDNVYYLGAQTYLHGIMMSTMGKIVEQNEMNIIQMREKFEMIDFVRTYREDPPYDTIIYRPQLSKVSFDHETEKRKFYTENNIKHWTGDW